MAKLGNGLVTVTTAGTAVRITSTSTIVDWILLMGLPGNSSEMVVGASTVDETDASRKGVPIPDQGTAGASTVLPLRLDGPLDLADLYFDAGTDAQSASYLYRAAP